MVWYWEEPVAGKRENGPKPLQSIKSYTQPQIHFTPRHILVYGKYGKYLVLGIFYSYLGKMARINT